MICLIRLRFGATDNYAALEDRADTPSLLSKIVQIGNVRSCFQVCHGVKYGRIS